MYFSNTNNLANLPSQPHSLHSPFSHENSEHLLSDAWYENKVRHDSSITKVFRQINDQEEA
jgi:hypothetical protein